MWDLQEKDYSADVLIDTWWNVNDSRTIYLTDFQFRFNRYMVECEFNSFDFCIFKAEF